MIIGLTVTEYNEDYYTEHAENGLDYLGHGYWQESYAKMVADGLNNSLIFDAGCACGSILNGFKKLGHKVVGVDLNPHMINLGKQHFGFTDSELWTGSIADTPIPDESVDLVHSAQVLEHIPDEYTDAILDELVRITKKGGKWFICLDAIRQGETKEMYMGDPTHVNIQPTVYWARKFTERGLLFDIESYNRFVNSPYGPTDGIQDNFYKSYPYWSVWTLTKE